jgi:hypothetical protein
MSDATYNGPPAPTPRSGQGFPLPESVRGRLEHFFDADFSDVRIHVGTEALKHGALAFTTSSDIHFAPGCHANTGLS